MRNLVKNCSQKIILNLLLVGIMIQAESVDAMDSYIRELQPGSSASFKHWNLERSEVTGYSHYRYIEEIKKLGQRIEWESVFPPQALDNIEKTIRNFDNSLAIIPNFLFAENAVINISQTTNWIISWVINLQYDTSVDQLKTIRNEIEDYVKKNEDYNPSLGYAVRVDKFAESSIDMYVRCFTKTDEWEEWLAVKERLAIEIKKIVEKNKASFAFPSQSIYVEKK